MCSVIYEPFTLFMVCDRHQMILCVTGTYYGPGKAVPEGDRKLFLAIESTQELAVQKAKVEITRLLKEELLKLQSSSLHHINKGRYQVL